MALTLTTFAWLSICVGASNARDGEELPDTLVVCPAEFKSALQPWIAYREQQGFRILVQPPASTSSALAAQIKQLAEKSPLKNVVLVGDAAEHQLSNSVCVPTAYIDARVNLHYGSEPKIATDHVFVDLDNDELVDLNIGRIPVRSARELADYVEKVIRFESNESAGDWQRRINLVAGVGGFGSLVDKMIEQSVKTMVTDLIPAEYDLTMTNGTWRSPFCPDPRRFSETVIERLNEGCLFWVYVGHADRSRLQPVRLPDRRCEVLNVDLANKVASHNGSPVAIFLSCYAGSFDDAQDGLAETLLKQERGPVAVIASSRVSMPYGMSIFSLELMEDYFRGQTVSLGDLISSAKRKLVQYDSRKSTYHSMIESMGQAFSPIPGLLAEERREHVHLMHLLGDPLLRLPRPAPLTLRAQTVAVPGEKIRVTGNAVEAGELSIDLSYRRDRFRSRPRRRTRFDPSDEALCDYQVTYEAAQQRMVTQQILSIPGGEFEIELTIPDDCSGQCDLRGMLQSSSTLAIGSTPIWIDNSK